MAFVFGSSASGKAGASSDVDLLVMGKVGLPTLVPRLLPLTSTLGREINPHVLSRESFSDKSRTGDALMASVLTFPKIWIQGDDDELERLG